MPTRESARRFHFLREIATGGFGSVFLTKVTHADGFSRLVAVKLLKSQPGRFNYGSSGNGTIVHLTGELFKSMTGTFVVHIPYRGTALVIPDMVSGQIHLLFDNIASAMPHLKDGRVRALAVTSLQRSAMLPQLPTVADAVPGFESTTWFGVFGPRGLSPEITTRLNTEINAALKASAPPRS